jgi:hypothetical protein
VSDLGCKYGEWCKKISASSFLQPREEGAKDVDMSTHGILSHIGVREARKVWHPPQETTMFPAPGLAMLYKIQWLLVCGS